MTKRDFEALAAIVSDVQIGSVRDVLARQIADYIQQEYPLFDRGRFIRACTRGEKDA